MIPNILILDASYILHRVLKLENFLSLKTSQGQFSGGIYGTISLLRSYLGRFGQINRAIVCWDSGRSIRRLAIDEGYKADRHSNADSALEEANREYIEIWGQQKYLLYDFLRSLGAIWIQVDGKEGDDTIAAVCRIIDGNKVVISDDKDFLQLVNPTCCVFRPMADEVVDVENFKDLVGIPRSMFLLFKCLLGDHSDNIPGIPKVGDTTACRIANKTQEFWGKEELPSTTEDWRKVITHDLVLACEDLINTDKRNAVRYRIASESLERIVTNLSLMDISQESFTDNEMQLIRGTLSADQVEVMSFFQRYEFGSMVKSFSGWLAPFDLLR
jgi:5'-3' exonuclease